MGEKNDAARYAFADELAADRIPYEKIMGILRAECQEQGAGSAAGSKALS